MNMNRRWIYSEETAANCFFRSALNPPDLKIMLQVTTRCNMHCKHCFLSAIESGKDISYSLFKSHIVETFKKSRVKKVTLTGGEPLLHPAILDIISDLHDANIQSCICTNASLVTEEMLKRIKHLNVHFNVSLDGISSDSYGLFREIQTPHKLSKVLNNINMIGQYNMLNGILTTPNGSIKHEEYNEICDFAIQAGANYLLLNPLSPFGRGKSASRLTLTSDEMNAIRHQLNIHLSRSPKNDSFHLIYIRFPNCDGKATASCTAGTIPYIFANGDIAICPYMVFAAENPDNDYSRSDYIVGNIFDHNNVYELIRDYQKAHSFCQQGNKQNSGCPAMKIAENKPLYAEDML